MQVGDLTLKPIEGSVDERIIRERNEEVKEIARKVEALREISQMLLEMAGEQGVELLQVEEKIEESTVNVESAVKIQEKVAEKVKKNKLVAWLSGGGAAGGAVIGSVGFVFNPIVGIVSMVALSALGFGTGHIIGKKVS